MSIADTKPRTISATDANRSFSTMLRGVEEGGSYLITSHGRPVALLVPAEEFTDDREASHQALLDSFMKLPTHHLTPWTRDELYADDPQ